jgi:hypothetical protein
MKNIRQIKELYKKYVEVGNDFSETKDRYYWGKKIAFAYTLKYYFNFDVDDTKDVEKLFN